MRVWLCLLAVASPALAQGGPGVEGNWMGTLNPGPAVKLRVGLKVAKAADGSLSAKLDSIDQGAKDLPISTIRQTGQAVALELKMLNASYDGTLNAAGSEITGTWRQGGGSTPLTFRRVDKVEVAAPGRKIRRSRTPTLKKRSPTKTRRADRSWLGR